MSSRRTENESPAFDMPRAVAVSDTQPPIATGRRPTLLWVQTADLNLILDAATWLTTAQALRENGWNVFLVQPTSDGSPIAMRDGLLLVPKPATYFLGQVFFHWSIMRWLFHRDDIDVVMFHELSTVMLLPARLRYVLSSRIRPLFIMDVRTLFMDAVTPRLRDRLRGYYYRYTYRLANLWVDGYLVITEQMASALSIRTERLFGVWPSGVDLGAFRSALEMRRWPSGDEPIRLVYIGTLRHERNLSALCRAVLEANTHGMNFQLSIVGSGNQQAELEALASTTSGVVSVGPPVPHREVWKVLANAHVGVLPFPDELKFRVSSPIKLFEYMAAGMPILATRVVCHTDVVGQDPYVFWAETADQSALVDALKQVWSGRDMLSALGRESRSAADRWTWQVSAAKLQSGLERAVREKKVRT
ncbi:MAG: glycosyltransferase [Lamprocystis purpurea]|uniref:glycosyltransferase n=1 Tax=Lamprocystis purpurea TaxID=61598 RepID=UPI0003735B5B|nr:glycosyltransferase [Lamprocystis purpurea]MBV5272305.1 glycosyltransferase [Lamprocystis purpurea]